MIIKIPPRIKTAKDLFDYIEDSIWAQKLNFYFVILFFVLLMIGFIYRFEEGRDPTPPKCVINCLDKL